MKLLRVGLGVLTLAVIGVGGMAYEKLSNPDLPTPEPVTRIVQLDQGWSDDDRARYHLPRKARCCCRWLGCVRWTADSSPRKN